MSRSLRLATLFLTFWGLQASYGDNATVTAALANGDAALVRLDLDAALTAFRTASQLDTNHYVVAWKLARALSDKATLTADRNQQKQLCRDAEQMARRAVALNPQDANGHTQLAIAIGKLALFEGQRRKVELSKEVKVEAEAALCLNPRDDSALHVLGVWNRELVQLNWVLRTFAEFIYGAFPPASLSQSVTNLQRAVTLAPNVVAHRVELGLTLIAAGKRLEAREQLEKAMELPNVWVTDDHYKAVAKQNYRRTTDT